MVFQAIPSKFSCATFQNLQILLILWHYFLAHEDVVVGFVIFHTKLSTPWLACFICSSLILQGSWSDHYNFKKKKKNRKRHSSMVWESWPWFVKGKVGRSAKLKIAYKCLYQQFGTALNLFSMEDSKKSIAIHWQKQPPLKTIFISVLQMKS
jgi:hypothetical protein